MAQNTLRPDPVNGHETQKPITVSKDNETQALLNRNRDKGVKEKVKKKSVPFKAVSGQCTCRCFC